jgi:poly-D-alanine transfer protein DltD
MCFCPEKLAKGLRRVIPARGGHCTEGLSKQEESINKRIKELDEIIATKTGQQQARAETERITRNNDLKKIEDLFNKLKQEKKRIKKLLK